MLRTAAQQRFSKINPAPRAQSNSQLIRSASIGSIREARRAGKYPASAATPVNITSIPANVTGSLDVTPNKSPLNVRASAHDATTPTTIPIAASPRVCNKIVLCSISADAPSAMRIPISCVRWLTEYEITA
jgi:hypothetical protein